MLGEGLVETSYGEGLAENVRIPSYHGGAILKLLKKRHVIFERFLMSIALKHDT